MLETAQSTAAEGLRGGRVEAAGDSAQPTQAAVELAQSARTHVAVGRRGRQGERDGQLEVGADQLERAWRQ